MLVLTRKRNEKIKIGDDIVITVVETSRGNVKLGIQAPNTVRVLRAELTELPASPMTVHAADDLEDELLLDAEMMNAAVFSEQALHQLHFESISVLEDQASRYLAN